MNTNGQFSIATPHLSPPDASEAAALDPAPILGHPRRALIVDCDPRSASHFKETLDRMGVHASTARSVAEAADLAAVTPPRLLVLTMPVRDSKPGLQLASELSARYGTACIVVLDRVEQSALDDAAAAGSHAVLCKPVHREQLEATFRVAMSREPVQPQPVRVGESAGRLVDMERALRAIAHVLAGVDVPVTAPAGPLAGLRPREREVVTLLLQHLRVPAIARRLGISQQTVRNHLKGVFRHTGVRSQQELLDRFAPAVVSNPPAAAASAPPVAMEAGQC
jgi:DNA-binding NarL/FixJ family response regulator